MHFEGVDCTDVSWPDLNPGEPPVVLVSQDESTFHGNDDVKQEWSEKGCGMSIKKKSRGALIMLSMFISELHGRLRCTRAQRDAYIQENRDGAMAKKLAALPSWDGDSMLMLEPGAGRNDKWFDAEQLIEQTKLAVEVFEASHFSPGRWVSYECKDGQVSHSSRPHALSSRWLPPTRCNALFLAGVSLIKASGILIEMVATDALQSPVPLRPQLWPRRLCCKCAGVQTNVEGARLELQSE